MSTSTRLRILEQLKKQAAVSTMELRQILGTTSANIRHHLSVLEQESLVQKIGNRVEGRGRPVYMYSLSRIVMGDGLDHLASALLDHIADGRETSERDADLRCLAKRVAAKHQLIKKDPLTLRLTGAVKFLSQLHYRIRWEAGMEGPLVIISHCPYQGIIVAHPELCRLDTMILEECIGEKVELDPPPVISPGQVVHNCIFFVRS